MSDEMNTTDEIKEISKEEFAIALDLFGLPKNKEVTSQPNQSTTQNSFENLVKELEESDSLVS